MKKGFAFILVLAILVSMVPVSALTLKKVDDKPRTGLKAPAAREAKLFQEKAAVAAKVLPNAAGLKRINENRRAKGLQPYPDAYAAAAGEEIVTKGGSAKSAQKYGAIYGSYGSLLGALPAAVDLSQSGYFPAIADQGALNSCASFATAYYAATYETAAVRGISLSASPGRILSPKFAYNLNNDGDDLGTSLEGNLLTLYTRGAPFIDEPSMNGYQYNGSDFLAPGVLNPLQYREYPQTAAIYNDALKNRLADAGILMDIQSDDGIDQVRQMLNNGHVLVFGTEYVFGWQTGQPVGNDPATAADDLFAGQKVSTGMVVPDPAATSPHALTVVGYNDDIWVDTNTDGTVDPFEKGALKIANSWGTGWMNDGFIWLSYDALKDANGHLGVVANNALYYLIAQEEYRPRATAEITLNTARRNELYLFMGVNWSEAGEPVAPILDYVFSSHWGGPYSFAGTTAASTATVVVDLTDTIIGSGFDSAGGMLSLCAGVGDDTAGAYVQRTDSVVFRTSRSVQALGTFPFSVNSQLKWFCGKDPLNGGDPPPYDPSIEALPVMSPYAGQICRSYGPDSVQEFRFVAPASGTYTFSSTLAGQFNGLEIQNAARQMLYIGMDSLVVPLYGGKTYLLRSWYADEAPYVNYTLAISISEKLTSESSARLAGLELSSGDPLMPAFAPDTTAYEIQAGPDFTLAATPEDPAASLVSGDKAGGIRAVTLPDDSRVRTRIEVTSKDWLNTRVYDVYASRGMPSANADLASLTAAGAVLGPAFTSATTDYTLTLPADSSGASLQAIAADARSSVTINGIPTGSIDLEVQAGGSTLATILVTAPDLKTSKTYRIQIGRPGTFAPGTHTIPADLFRAGEVTAAPDRATVYLIDTVGRKVNAIDLETGTLKSLTFPYEPRKVVHDGEMLLVALKTPAANSDEIAIVDPVTFTQTSRITTRLDIRTMTGFGGYIYLTNGYDLGTVHRASGVEISPQSSGGYNDLRVNPVNGRLYATGAYTILSFQNQDGVLRQTGYAEYNSPYGTFSPDGQHLLLGSGVVLTCGSETTADLEFVTDLDVKSQTVANVPVATNKRHNEAYLVRENLIQAYDASDFTYRRSIMETGQSTYMLSAGGDLILGQLSKAGDLTLFTTPIGTTLQSLRFGGDIYSEVYPLRREIDGGEVASTVSSIAVEALPAVAGANVAIAGTAAAGASQVPLAPGANVIPLTVTDPVSGQSATYRLTLTRRASDPPQTPRNGLSGLGFTPFDMVLDPDREVAYLTEAKGRSLFRVDLKTGAVMEKSFPLLAERLSVRNGKVYLTLLRSGHSYYDSRYQDGFGAFAVIDTATFRTDAIYNTNIDPYDIETDPQGNVYLAPGSNQWTYFYTYSGTDGRPLSSSQFTHMSRPIARNPVTGKLYGVDTSGSPRDLHAIEVADGRTVTGYDSPYHGNYPLTNALQVSPDGASIFNGSGAIFTSAPQRTGDMVYEETLDVPFTALSFDQPGDRFYTASGKTLRAYDYATRTPLQTLVSASEFVMLFPDGRNLMALQKSDTGVHAIRRFTVDAILGGILLNGSPLAGFDPNVREYALTLSSETDTIDLAATAFANACQVTGDTGRLPFAMGANTYSITALAPGGVASTYTLRITRVPMTDANLAGIHVTAGLLAPEFASDVLNYALVLDEATQSTTITPLVEDSLATVAINGYVMASKTVYLTGTSNSYVNVDVTAHDGTTRKRYSINVTHKVTKVSAVYLDRTQVELLAGGEYALKASISPAQATNRGISWTSSAPGVATVDTAGVVRAVSAGLAEIAVTTADGGFRAKCTVIVTPSRIEISNASGGRLVADRSAGILKNVSVNTSVAQLKANLSNPTATIVVLDRSGNPYLGESLATGMVVKLYSGSLLLDSLTLSVLGDISGDGAIDINDILYIRANILETYTMPAHQTPAADISGDGTIDINDILYIRAHIIGTYTITAK